VREWRRRQAVRLLADGGAAPEVAAALNCSVSSVESWAAAWRDAGVAGRREGAHAGGGRQLDAQAEAASARLLTDDPQAHG
jgi:transposase